MVIGAEPERAPSDRIEAAAEIGAKRLRHVPAFRQSDWLRLRARGGRRFRQPLLERRPGRIVLRGRGLGFDRLDQQAGGRLHLRQASAAFGAQRHVGRDRYAPSLLERTVGIFEHQLVADVVVYCHDLSPSASRSLEKASRIRDFTVPIGRFSLSAIMLWEASS